MLAEIGAEVPSLFTSAISKQRARLIHLTQAIRQVSACFNRLSEPPTMQEIFPQVVPIQNFPSVLGSGKLPHQVPNAIMTIPQTHQWVGQRLSVDEINQGKVFLEQSIVIDALCIRTAMQRLALLLPSPNAPRRRTLPPSTLTSETACLASSNGKSCRLTSRCCVLCPTLTPVRASISASALWYDSFARWPRQHFSRRGLS